MIAGNEEKNFREKNLLILSIGSGPNVTHPPSSRANCIGQQLVHPADPGAPLTGFQNLPVLSGFLYIPSFQESLFWRPVFVRCSCLPAPSCSCNHPHDSRPFPASLQEHSFLSGISSQ